jgi:hypothetical protein
MECEGEEWSVLADWGTTEKESSRMTARPDRKGTDR